MEDIEQENKALKLYNRKDESCEYPLLESVVDWNDIREKQPKEGAQVYFLFRNEEYKGSYNGCFFDTKNQKWIYKFAGNNGYGGILSTIQAIWWKPRKPTEGRITCATFQIG